MIKKVHQNSKKNPEILIITPLRPTDKISKETKVSVKRNNTPFIWYSYSGEGNVMENFLQGKEKAGEELEKLPSYTIKIDNDTEWSRNTLDKMYSTLIKHPFAFYCYCSFEYVGATNAKFPAIPFDPERLKKANYISSNTLFLTKILDEVPPPTDDYYQRLLDWAYYLKLLSHEYKGVPCPDGYFVAKSSEDSVSSRGIEDYKIKHKRVVQDFT